MIEKDIDRFLNEDGSGAINTSVFASYKRDYLNAIKKAERQLEKDMVLFVQKNKVNAQEDEIKQWVKDDIEGYFENDVSSHVYYNLLNMIDV